MTKLTNTSSEIQDKLSIIIPIYNVEQYLKECLDNIYQLENINFEVILINDGSTDHSKKIIEDYSNKFPQITIVINKKNGGLSSARNMGISYATGNYISFIDSDDYIDAGLLQKLFTETVKSEVDIGIGGKETFWGEKCKTYVPYDMPKKIPYRTISSGKDQLENFFKNKYFKIAVWDCIYKTNLLKDNKINFLENVHHEDLLFTFQAFFLADKTMVFPYMFYFYRQRSGSIMTGKSDHSYQSRLIITQKVIKLFTLHNYQGKVFDDYLIYQLWTSFTGKGFRDFKLLFIFLKRKNYSISGLVKLMLMLIIPKFVLFNIK